MKKKVYLINVDESCPVDAMKGILNDIDVFLTDETDQSLKVLGHGVTVKMIELEKGSQFYIVRGESQILDEKEYLIKDIVQ